MSRKTKSKRNSEESEESATPKLLEPIPLVRILFLLLIKKNPSCTGYNLIRLVSEFTDGVLNLRSGTVYNELRKMEKVGLLQSELDETGRRLRKYQITRKGIQEMQRLTQQIKIRTETLLLPILNLAEEE